jgi:hypothetical protein
MNLNGVVKLTPNVLQNNSVKRDLSKGHLSLNSRFSVWGLKVNKKIYSILQKFKNFAKVNRSHPNSVII